MGGKTSNRVQERLCALSEDGLFLLYWPFLASCELAYRIVKILQNPPI
jgi:hypothetical protein